MPERYQLGLRCEFGLKVMTDVRNAHSPGIFFCCTSQVNIYEFCSRMVLDIHLCTRIIQDSVILGRNSGWQFWCLRRLSGVATKLCARSSWGHCEISINLIFCAKTGFFLSILPYIISGWSFHIDVFLYRNNICNSCRPEYLSIAAMVSCT